MGGFSNDPTNETDGAYSRYVSWSEGAGARKRGKD